MITCALALLVTLVSCNSDILILDQTTFSLAKSEFEYLLVYFYDQNCSECQETTELFRTSNAMSKEFPQPNEETDLNKRYSSFLISEKVQFAEIELKGNEKVFEQEKIDSVPEIRIYYKENNKVSSFPLIELTEINLDRLSIWVKRFTSKELSIINSLVSLEELKYEKSFVIDCGDSQFKSEIVESEAYLKYVYINFVCLVGSNLNEGEALLKSKNEEKTIECFKGSNWKFCESKINNFEFKGLVHWSDNVINHLYNKNFEVFVLVTSNESISHEYVRNLTTIKLALENENENNEKVLPIFAVADIHYDLQNTMRIKKFIGGFDQRGWPYPFPIFAYLKIGNNGEVIKYIYELKYSDSPKSPYSLQEWVERAMKHNLTRDFRNLNGTSEFQPDNNFEDKTTYKIVLPELLKILQNGKKVGKNPLIHLYVYWRNNWDMQVAMSRNARWWGKTKYHSYLFNFDYLENELPFNITPSYLPALITFYTDQSYSIHEGVKNEKEVEAIIKEIHQKKSH